MANPIQEYQTARSMPIPALIAVLNGQSDMVSLGVAHAALKEKMEAEVAKKGANAMQMAQAPKVVQKDMQMAQGLASTPADLNVPMGGIVGNEGQMTQSAAGGGSVVAFQAGGAPPPTFGGMMATQAARAPGFMDRLRQGIGAADRFATGRGGLLGPQLALTPTATNVGEQEYLDLIKKLASLGYSAEVIEAMTPEQRVAAAAQGPLQAGPTDTGGVPTQSLAQLEAAQAKPPETAPPPGGIADIAAAQAQVKQPTGYSDLMSQAKEMAKEFKTEEGDTKDVKGFTQDYVNALKEGGFDFNLVRDQIEEVRKEKEKLAGEKKEAANLRLIEAGLGILGGESPYAFVNIGKGATPALQGLAKDLKEIKKTSRALDKETMQLKLMQNQMAEGKVKYGIEQFNKQEERAAKLDEKKKEIEFRIFDRLSSNETQKYVADQQAETSRTNLQATNIERAAKRDLDTREAAMKQAAEDVKMMAEGPEKEAQKIRLYRKYYAQFTAKQVEGASDGNVLRFDAQGNPI